MRVLDFRTDADGDMVADNGDIALVGDVDGIKQLVGQYLAFYLGEWFLDEEIGVPYFERILIKNPSLVEVREWMRQTILSVPGVREVLSLTVEYTGNRIVDIVWRANTDLGELAGRVQEGS